MFMSSSAETSSVTSAAVWLMCLYAFMRSSALNI